MKQKKIILNFGHNAKNAKKIYILMYYVKIKTAQFFIKGQKLKKILQKPKKFF